MTSNRHDPLDIYCIYPENPYDFTPPIFNLIPFHSTEDADTPEMKQAVLDIARRTGINVLDCWLRYTVCKAEAGKQQMLVCVFGIINRDNICSLFVAILITWPCSP